MSDEILKLRGRLAAASDLIKTLETGIGVDIDELRSLADRHIEDKCELRGDRMVIVVQRLAGDIERLKTLTAQAAELRRDLGIPAV